MTDGLQVCTTEKTWQQARLNKEDSDWQKAEPQKAEIQNKVQKMVLRVSYTLSNPYLQTQEGQDHKTRLYNGHIKRLEKLSKKRR